ncbi:spore protease YyaC [Virgibacillus alimentarius]|uniref:spore protease YyaC n=1 Tax=Virgibacillus alimentarius TaxID=698769 RepID=UPI0004933C5A|nr:spore protease YyaC [Virgibacillus alimentarius]
MNLKRRTSEKNKQLRLPHTDPHFYEKVSEQIISWFPAVPREYVAIFIGTDRSTGDALGPLAGTFLSEKEPKYMSIYGTLHHPIHATNLEISMDTIKRRHKNPYIIAVDACLGKTTSVGDIITGLGPLKPGAALNKPLPPIGDVHITGVVNISGFMEYNVLQNTRLSVVVDMANQIADLLDVIDQRLTYDQTLSAVVAPSKLKRSI